jgi:hypothetical protein
MTITEEDLTPILERLARLLVVREVERQDVARLHGRRVKAFTEAQAALRGAADATYRVVNGWGPEQVLTATAQAVGEVPVYTSAGRRAWFEDRVERLTMELRFIYRDEN